MEALYQISERGWSLFRRRGCEAAIEHNGTDSPVLREQAVQFRCTGKQGKRA